MSDDLVSRIDGLIVQATKERSHYYTASVLKEAKLALTEARAEIERLRGELADTKDDFLRRHKDAVDRFERIRQLESELSTLRARVREVVGPFADLAQRYDDTVSGGWVSWAEFVADHAWPTETNCRAARQLMEEVK